VAREWQEFWNDRLGERTGDKIFISIRAENFANTRCVEKLCLSKSSTAIQFCAARVAFSSNGAVRKLFAVCGCAEHGNNFPIRQAE
jgi:hypothetical protein